MHKLNLFEFAELCINLERPHMAAVAMALCRDVGKRYQMKKVGSLIFYSEIFI